MKTYTYALVKVKGLDTGYSYISDEGNLHVGDYVLVPFGAGNIERAGEVVDVKVCTAEEAPFPVEKTKHILRKLTSDEYEEAKSLAHSCPPESWSDQEDMEEMEEYLKTENEYDYEYLLDWACDHHEDSMSPRMAHLVMLCYALCAEQHIPLACLNFGTFYYTGRFVEQDYVKAAQLYKIAADSGIDVAIRNLGYCYYYGRHQAVDFQKAFEYFNKGALLFGDANCFYKLGDLYRKGKGVEQNEKYAYILYRNALSAAKQHERYAFCKPDIFYRLGLCHFKGIGTHRDMESAHHFLQKALDGFYARRKTDPFVAGLIKKTKAKIRKVEKALDQEIL